MRELEWGTTERSRPAARGDHVYLADLADALRWQRPPEALAVWTAEYDALLERRVEEHCSKRAEDACILEALALLPAVRRRRFLRSPGVAAKLLQDHEGGFPGRATSDLLLAELAAVGLIPSLPKPLWTARGDRLFSQGGSEGWDPTEPCLGDTGITLDERSPFAFPDDGLVIQTRPIPTAAERALVREKLAGGFAALRASCPIAARFVPQFLEVIAPRREATPSATFHSSSFARYVGLVRITNAHLEQVDAARLSETYVHEGIHGLLYTYEELQAPFLPTNPLRHLKVRSPWSGATIRLGSYIHAVAAWYGVYWFWRAVADSGVYPADRCQELLRRAEGGFRRHPVTVGLQPHRHVLSPETGVVLEELERRILAA
jgi:hypothetical protein